jgi:hypothetical protein
MWEGRIMDQLKMSDEPITGEDLCVNCTHCILQGNPKQGENYHAYFCGYEENLIETEDFVRGIRTFWAPLASTINDGGCMDFEAIS